MIKTSVVFCNTPHIHWAFKQDTTKRCGQTAFRGEGGGFGRPGNWYRGVPAMVGGPLTKKQEENGKGFMKGGGGGEQNALT